MEKGKVFIFGITIVCFFCALYLEGESKTGSASLERIEELQREIRVLNLVNGLDLTQEQMEMILSSAREIKQLREQFKSSVLFRQEEMGTLLEEIKRYVKDRKEIPASTVKRYHRLNREIKEARAKMEDRIRQLAKEIEEHLESHQLYQIEQFIPCIIPPQGEARIGRANENSGITRSLERIRRIPASLYHLKKEDIFRRTLEGMKLHAAPDMEFDEEEARLHILSLYDEARQLDDAEFEIQKEKLAEKLISPFKPDHPPARLDRKISAFLLSPEIVTILEDKKGSL